MMRKARIRDVLPPLVFGEAQAAITSDAKFVAEQTAKAITSLICIEPVSRDEAYLNKIATVNINGLNLVACAATPSRIDVGSTEDFHLFIPFHGRSCVAIDGVNIEWGANDKAMLFATCSRRMGCSETKSSLLAHIEPRRLTKTACAMLGEEDEQKLALDLNNSRALALHFGAMNFTTIFRQLAIHVDSLLGNGAALEMLAIDDLFYRHVACLLNPGLFMGDEDGDETVRPASNDPVDAVCEAVRSRRHRQLTLTEMEMMSGLSRRSLQNAFRKRFGCSPMQWQQRERLHLAREMLRQGLENGSITELSLELGSSSPSRFTAFYGRMFGETPSATMCRKSLQ